MAANEQHSLRRLADRKPTVKIIKPRSRYRGPIISFLTIALVAVVVLAYWRAYLPEPVEAVERRDIYDVMLDWRCDGGHYFRAPGARGWIPCEKCGKPAYPVETRYCPEHGPFPVSVRFDPSATELHVQWRRIADGAWQQASEPLTCPRCSKLLYKKPRDPLAKTSRDRRKLDDEGAGG